MTNNTLARQFEKPKGFLGKIVGLVMYFENRKINRWTINKLKVRKCTDILEIGYGPGYAIHSIMSRYRTVSVDGIDLSGKMKTQAEKVNRDWVEMGKVQLFKGDIQNYNPGKQYEHVFSVNNYPLWDKQEQSLKRIYRIMKTGGKLALTVQPREEGSDDQTARDLGDKMQADLENAGFKDVHVSFLKARPVLTVCATATKIN
ncbi:class I SAM-dependent methyltransferase [Mesobacillus harenae]|uniref:class I SAM-dependent methyltransferase n=1 Tax=Mesobacillus harenae TaxID=2213203 RepID=UPI0015803CB8|nr:class I SAM-dependent methyltransferase [Mesobacillus harenae]